MVDLKEAAAPSSAGVRSLAARLPMVALSEPWPSQWIRLPPSTCHRHPGLRKADACEWPLRRARALPGLVALRLQRLRREALPPSTCPSEIQCRTGLVPALGTHPAAYVRR